MSEETRFRIYCHIQAIKAIIGGCWTLVKFAGVFVVALSPYIVAEIIDRCDGRTPAQIEECIKQNKVR